MYNLFGKVSCICLNKLANFLKIDLGPGEVLTSKNGHSVLPVKGDFSKVIDTIPFFYLFKDNSFDMSKVSLNF